MCLAIPGKVVRLDKDSALIRYPGTEMTARIVSRGIRVGDYVLVQAGIVLGRIPEKEALACLKAWKSIK